MSIESSGEPLDAYDQLPRGLRASIAGTPYEERMREAASAGLIPDGYVAHLFLHALGESNSLNDEDRKFQAWLEGSIET